MKVCLVDNNTAHMEKVLKLVSEFSSSIVVQNRENFSESIAESCDLVIIAGSRDKSLVRNIPLFEKQIKFVKTTNMPFIGICMGFQMLCISPDCKIGRLKIKETGLVKLSLNQNCPYITQEDCYVYNHHRWTILSVGNELISYASSENCIQFVKHEEKPHFGFQFHPEIREPENSGYRIFSKVIEEIF
jgi:GMP synthase-like glutamine amidotransferase